MYFLLYQDFYLKKGQPFLRKNDLDVEHFKIHMHFNLDRIFLVCLVGHRQIQYKKISQIIYKFV